MPNVPVCEYGTAETFAYLTGTCDSPVICYINQNLGGIRVVVKVSIGTQLSPEVKAAGHRRAAEERRSFASYLEWLIMRDAKANPAPPPPKKPRVRRAAKVKTKTRNK